MKDKNEISLVKNDSKFYVLENIFSVQIINLIFGIIIGSIVILKEFNNGILKHTLTKGYSRTKVFFSFLLTIVFLVVLVNLVMFISHILFISIFSRSLEVFTLKIPLINNEIYYVNYLLCILGKFFTYMIPILFISILSFCLSIIFSSNTVAISAPILFSLFGLFVAEWFFGFKIRFLEYTFLPYLDFTIFNNIIDVINFNMMYGVNINMWSGIIILCVNIILFIIISLLIFIKKDIK